MKYKLGDKVKMIRNKEYPSKYLTVIDKLPDRVATIREIYGNKYFMEEIIYAWFDTEIECLEEDYKKQLCDPIHSRFEILDL